MNLSLPSFLFISSAGILLSKFVSWLENRYLDDVVLALALALALALGFAGLTFSLPSFQSVLICAQAVDYRSSSLRAFIRAPGVASPARHPRDLLSGIQVFLLTFLEYLKPIPGYRRNSIAGTTE